MNDSKIKCVGKDGLQCLCDTSNSYKEVLEKLGLAPRGNNYKTLHKYIDQYDISTEHINEARKVLTSHSKYNKESFIESITTGKCLSHSRNIIRRMVQYGIKEYRCEICGITDWNNQYIRLELHHKNGKHNDNTLDNLQLLCPNCHSQTDNFRALNIR